jgi:1-aminocyclopropane-1-carboxylate deaminase
MCDFEADQGILLDPVYTAKLCFAIDKKIRLGEIPFGSRVITLHTGGLQGRSAMQHRIEDYYKNDNEALVKYA